MAIIFKFISFTWKGIFSKGKYKNSSLFYTTKNVTM